MVVAVDIGGTKTLVALVDQKDQALVKYKFKTNHLFDKFVADLSDYINNIQKENDKKASVISIGCAGSIDRKNGIILNSPNLGWLKAPLKQKLVKSTYINNIYIENDANLAGLAEAYALKNINQKVMYITFSTGVGAGFIDNGRLEPSLLDAEIGYMLFRHENKMMYWESFASGKSIVKKYGKMAAELNDEKAWKEISKNMAIGIVDSCAIFMPDTVIVGGGVGTHFDKYRKYLKEEVARLVKKSVMLKEPKIVQAKHAEEAVLNGTIILAKQYAKRI
jgi:glucokinase